MKYNLINFCEFDKYAIKSYCAIHDTNENKNLGDIREVESLSKCDLLTYGFPCQDISVAGLQAGIEKGTRSGLLLEVEKLLENCEYKPKFLIMENVKNLVGKKFKSKFDDWILKLEEFGYNTYWEILNAKDYGIPQNRERIFAVSIRKDIDVGFEFPEKQELGLNIFDLCEEEVEDKFYITDATIEKILNSDFAQERTRIQNNVSQTLLARDWKDPKCIQVGNLKGSKWDKMHESSKRVYSDIGISPTLHTCQGGNIECKVLFNDTEKVRKLIPLEYWRLMGFSDEDFIKAQTQNSNTQLYKQAGNSIVVNVLCEIYKKLKEYYPNDFIENIDMISLFSGIGAFEKALRNI